MVKEGVLHILKGFVSSLFEDGHPKWERHIVLLNIPGQKYLLGSKFRKEVLDGGNELFIFCFKQNTQDCHCQINCCSNGQFWIQEKSFNSATYINGNRVGAKEPKEIKFGDILSFYIENISEARKRYGKTRSDFPFAIFIFREQCKTICNPLRGSSEIYFGNENPSNWQIDLVVSNILSHLPINDLKLCRLVSHLWNREGQLILKRKCIISVGSNRYENPSEWAMLFKFFQEMKNFPVQSWNFTFPTFGNDGSAATPNYTERREMFKIKYLSDFQQFILGKDAISNSVKSLSVHLPFPHMAQTLLQNPNLSPSQLQTLVLIEREYEFNENVEHDEIYVKLVQSLLEKTANGLKTLEFYLPNSSEPIQIPIFLKLGTLRIGFGRMAKLVTNNGNLQYNDSFPELLNLTVCPKNYGYLKNSRKLRNGGITLPRNVYEYWDNNVQIFQWFFPVNIQNVKVFKKLQFLEFPHLETFNVKDNTFDKSNFSRYNRQIRNIAEMFPNVHNEWIDVVAQGKYYEDWDIFD